MATSSIISVLTLAFSLAVLAENAITTVTVQPPTTTSPSYASDTTFRNTILDVSNRYRREHNATALTWNDTLVRSASSWAEQCRWKHSGSPSGENLAEGYANATAAVEAWGDERRKYNFNKPGFSHDTGHFTQLVWKATRTVGCGRFDCGNGSTNTHHSDPSAQGWYVVCEYYPRGNVVGGDEFAQNVQRQVEGKPYGAAGTIRVWETWAVIVILVSIFFSAFGVV